MRYLFLFVLLLIGGAALAQPDDGVCPAVVEEAVALIGDNCRDLDRNTACFGNSQVVATFFDEVPQDFFTSPGETAPVIAFQSIDAFTDIERNDWGIAVLNLQASLPDTLQGQAVDFLVIGDASIESAEDFADVESPLQAFYFLTGVGQPQCKQAPSVIAIRSPQDFVVDFTANGARINLGSIIALRVLEPGNTMQLITIEGQAVLEPETELEVTVPGGFTALRCLDEAEDRGIDGASDDQEVVTDCVWTEPRELNEDEVILAETVIDLFEALDGTACTNGGANVRHTVVSGENLFRIARRYSTTIEAISAENGITNPQSIVVGQQLSITCAIDTGASTIGPALPPVRPPGTSGN